MKRTALRRISDRQRARLAAYAKVRKAWLADRGLCEVCKYQPTTDVHHQRGKISTLLCDTRFWTACCRECHSWLHGNPKEARRLNFTAPAREWNVPVPLEEHA